MGQGMIGTGVEIRGMDRRRKRLGDDELVRKPVESGLTKLHLLTERTARAGAPKDTSALARSIITELKPLWRKVHSPLVYHPTAELGRPPGGRMPPPDALAGWARRHGYSGSLFVLARAIARRGTKGRFYMRAAAKAARNALPGVMGGVSKDIEARWRRV